MKVRLTDGWMDGWMLSTGVRAKRSIEKVDAAFMYGRNVFAI